MAENILEMVGLGNFWDYFFNKSNAKIKFATGLPTKNETVKTTQN